MQAKELPEGIYFRTPIDQVTLAEAVEQVDDPAFFYETMPAVLFHYSVGDYWGLTVGDHARLVAYLQERGLYGD